MKKLLILPAVFALAATTVIAAEADRSAEVRAVAAAEAESTRPVTVYKIQGSGVVTAVRKSGVYDSSDETLTVDGSTYSVSYNPYYGEDGKRGQYQYVAGGIYYFNL